MRLRSKTLVPCQATVSSHATLGEASKKIKIIVGLLAKTRGGGLGGSEGPNLVESFFKNS